MDAFFAACEVLDRPELASIPFAVGGMGMISTANYEARKFGVRSAMPGARAPLLSRAADRRPGNPRPFDRRRSAIGRRCDQRSPAAATVE